MNIKGDKMQKIIPVSIVTGYLGSGKTTFINHVLSNSQGYKIAVIVNDIGEVNIDAELIEKGGVVSSKEQELVSLANGCICCTLRKDLIEQVLGLATSGKFDHIFIEASGICEPIPIAQSIQFIEQSCMQQFGSTPCKLDAVISVVDALRMSDEFENGNKLIQKNREDDIENIVIKQIEFCNVLILNKTSLISEEKLNQVRQIVKALQPEAKILETDFSAVDLKDVLDTNLFDFEKVSSSAGWIKQFESDTQEIEDHNHKHHHDHEKESEDHHCKCHQDEDEHDEEHHCKCGHHHEHDDECECEEECHCGCHGHHHEHSEHCNCNACRGEKDEFKINTYVYYRRKGFDRQKFEEFQKQDFGRRIIRTKGMIYFSDEPDTLYIYEQAGTQRVLEDGGLFYATMPENQLKELKKDPKFMEMWDDEYGDRMIKLVFIGQNLDKHKIKERLDQI